MNKYIVFYFVWILTGAISCKTVQTESETNNSMTQVSDLDFEVEFIA